MKKIKFLGLLIVGLGVALTLFMNGCAKSSSDTPSFTIHTSTSAT